jgi:ribosomal protein L11 methylase PrmA
MRLREGCLTSWDVDAIEWAMSGWQLALRVDSSLAGPLENLLAARKARVWEESDPSIDGDNVLLVAAFEGQRDPIIMDAVGSWLLNLHASDSKVYTRLGPSDAWSEGWRAVLGSFQVSKRVWVVPSWDVVPPEAEIAVHLESSLAFGIGGHPTTRGMLTTLDALLFNEPGIATVLDVGSGSGILALAAGHLGASVLGVETDPTAVAESQRNLSNNELHGAVSFELGNVGCVSDRYDAVVANLYPATLKAEADNLQTCVGQHLLVSGFYEASAEEIRSFFPELDLVKAHCFGGWSVLHLERQTEAYT